MTSLGVWLIGARGAVSLCSLVGALALRKGLVEPTGLVSALPFFKDLDFVPWDSLVFGGWDIQEVPLKDMAWHLAEGEGLFPSRLLARLEKDLEGIEENLMPGVLGEQGVVRAGQVRSALCQLSRHLEEFRKRHKVDRLLVINVASTIGPPLPPCLESLSELEKWLFKDREIPTSIFYAYVALKQGAAYINFTPSPASEFPALCELAEREKVPHGGKDGKTGETLVKTVLAPMFQMRHLRVLSWVGYNILGNQDGRSLEQPEGKQAKISTKSQVLESLLSPPPHTHKVGIDYVPSLGDWKTAWDFIHFEGFLGTKMTFQFIWQGADSILAAPLVLDLIRFTEHAWRLGSFGLLSHLAPFFKQPLGENVPLDFFSQNQLLLQYYRRCYHENHCGHPSREKATHP